jgi:hypothetical protein
LGFSHGLTTIVRIGLGVGRVSWSCAVSGAPAADSLEVELELELELELEPELELVAPPSGGGGVPGLGTNAAEGRKLVPVTPPGPVVHFGTSTSLVP